MNLSSGANWLIGDHPDAYLYGALVHAAHWMGGDPRMGQWERQYEKAMEGARRSLFIRKFSAGPVRMRYAGPAP